MQEKTVCVTGNRGQLGISIVNLLLKRGYTVRCAFSTTSEDLVDLMYEKGCGSRLQLIKVDLFDHRSLVKLFQDCCGVFHIPASYYTLNRKRDYPVEQIDYEVRSVLNIVEACAKLACVKRLVLTSCMSAMLWDKDFISSATINENNWSNLDFCKKQKLWCGMLKTVVEKAAWALARDRDFDLVVINPATIIESPPRMGITPSNSNIYIDNSNALDETGIFAYVHVKDLALAHFLAFEVEHAFGRYACFERVLSKADIMEAAMRKYPNQPILHRLESFEPCPMSNEKLLTLGMNFGLNEVDVI